MKVNKLVNVLIVFVIVLLIVIATLSFIYTQKEDENLKLGYYIDYTIRNNHTDLIPYNNFDWEATDYREYMLDK